MPGEKEVGDSPVDPHLPGVDSDKSQDELGVLCHRIKGALCPVHLHQSSLLVTSRPHIVVQVCFVLFFSIGADKDILAHQSLSEPREMAANP